MHEHRRAIESWKYSCRYVCVCLSETYADASAPGQITYMEVSTFSLQLTSTSWRSASSCSTTIGSILSTGMWTTSCEQAAPAAPAPTAAAAAAGSTAPATAPTSYRSYEPHKRREKREKRVHKRQKQCCQLASALMNS